MNVMRMIDRRGWTRAWLRRRVAAPLTFAVVVIAGVGTALAAFSGDGRQTTDFGGIDSAAGVAIQSDGGVVAAGVTATPSHAFALARYTEDGELDSSFSGDGKQTTDFGSGALDVALQANDKIVVVGSIKRQGSKVFTVLRYTADGELDDSFSGNGKVTTGFPRPAGATAVAIQSDGRIVVLGTTSSKVALVRYRKNGELDRSFSKNGKQTADLDPDGFESAGDVALQDDGRIVVAGGLTTGRNESEFHTDIASTRFKPKGQLDHSFSDDGKRLVKFGAADSSALGTAIQSNGRIVLAGVAGSGPATNDFALARLRQNGRLDASFSGDGKKRTDFGDFDVGEAVGIQSDGKLVVVGHTTQAPVGFALARYRKDGSLDDSFSGDGRQITDIGSARAVAIQTDGKIVAVGLTGHPAYDFAIARYLPNGELDD